MDFMDRQKPEVRALIREYGFTIVTELYDGGSIDALKYDLEVWRERRQEAIANGHWGLNLT